MILRTLYLKLEASELSTERTYDFLLRSRVLCSFLEREVLRRLDFESPDFNRLVVTVTDEARSPRAFVNSEKVACVDLPYVREQLKRLETDDDFTRFFVERLREGIKKAARTLALPTRELLAGVKAFERGGGRNEWLHSTKTFKRLGVTASLHCRMTQRAFWLRLKVARGDEVVFEKDLLKTKPNELVFERRFKDVAVVGTEVVVTSRLGKPLWKMPLTKLNHMLRSRL